MAATSHINITSPPQKDMSVADQLCRSTNNRAKATPGPPQRNQLIRRSNERLHTSRGSVGKTRPLAIGGGASTRTGLALGIKSDAETKQRVYESQKMKNSTSASRLQQADKPRPRVQVN